MILTVLFIAIMSFVISAVLMPEPKATKPVVTFPPTPRPRSKEPELEHDFSAFWRYPDWDSGPLDEPFWMRPLKLPIRDLAFENSANFNGMPIIPGRYRMEPVILERYTLGKDKPERVKSYRYFVDDQEVTPPALPHPPKV